MKKTHFIGDRVGKDLMISKNGIKLWKNKFGWYEARRSQKT